MRFITLAGIAVLCLCMTSCFKEEPLNAECDIESAWIHYDNPEEYTWNLSDTIFKNINTADSTITFRVKPGVDRTSLAPHFAITQGAVMLPASGSAHDFSQGPVTYQVMSEDGNWSRVYKVSVLEQRPTPVDPEEPEGGSSYQYYNFENYRLYSVPNSSAKYYVWSDLDTSGNEINNWATGNGGFKISNATAKPDDYPTVPVDNGYKGAAVKLVTRATGPIAAATGKSIAAGNLFLGTFDATKALTRPMEATRFGLPFDKKPLTFSGFYKYSPGEKCQDGWGNAIEGMTDKGSIYAVLYRNHDDEGNSVVLHGDNVKTSPQIVAIAEVPEIGLTEEWTRFDITFDYSGNEMDMETLNRFGYSLAVVFSSSAEGAHFKGAVGSTLYVDEVWVTCESKK